MERKSKSINGLRVNPFVVIAENSVFSLIIVFLVAIILANVFFYKYYILNQQLQIEIEQNQDVVDEVIYNDLIKNWADQDKKLQDSTSKAYINFFSGR